MSAVGNSEPHDGQDPQFGGQRLVGTYGETGRLFEQGVDLLDNKQILMEADMVVLATAIEPNADVRRIATMLTASIDTNNFLTEAHAKLRPVESPTAGVFLSGVCQGPKDIPETVAQAGAAAVKAIGLLAKDKLMTNPCTAKSDELLCNGCSQCANVCPYGAISYETKLINDHGTATAPWRAVNNFDELDAALGDIHYPAVLKTVSGGYDGHGQRVLKTEADIAGALPLLAVPCILEEFVPFDSEASIVMVADGERVVSFPVGRNVHRDGILDLCIVPAEVDSGVLARMKAQSERFMRDCGYRGILAIEYFIKGGEIYFNEMAPRPHNSGHYTIEGTTTNQFRELVRFLLGEPLQEPRLVAPTVMKNILGQDLEAAEAIAAENRPGVHVRLYGKTESRPKRSRTSTRICASGDAGRA